MARRRGGSIFVEVEVDEWDIEEAGYHHEDDCPAKGGAPKQSDRDVLMGVISELHATAHPEESLTLSWCTLWPCRGLFDESINRLKVVAS